MSDSPKTSVARYAVTHRLKTWPSSFDALAAEQTEREMVLTEYDQAHAEGLNAYQAGMPASDCPHPKGSGIFREGWLDGYHR